MSDLKQSGAGLSLSQQLVQQSAELQKYTTRIAKVNPIKYSYLYLMFNNRNGYYKIGKSNNPSFREKTLQAEDPDVVLLYKWHCPTSQEKRWHSLFQAKRLRGEWFRLDLEDISLMTREMTAL